MFDIDRDEDTFITGGGLPGKKKKKFKSKQVELKKVYDYEEDELLDDLEKHENDMKEMMKFLTDCEDMIASNDLQ